MQDDPISPIILPAVYAPYITIILMYVNIFHNIQDLASKCSGGLAKKVRWFDPKHAVL